MVKNKILIILIILISLSIGVFFVFQNIFVSEVGKPKVKIQLILIGPNWTEVGKETIFKIVDKKGQPIKNVIVIAKNKTKLTNENGEVSFIFDKIGSYKILAFKDGFVSKKLLLVKPKGNSKLEIRAIRFHPEHCNCFPYRYVLAGANFATLKAYYLLDDNGNIYPSMGPFFGNGTWLRVSWQDWFNWLAQDIKFLRGFGLKIFLHGQIFPSAKYELRLNDRAKQNFKEQWKKAAIKLTKFAESQKVEILDPFGMGSRLIPLPEQQKLYEDILPEIRKIYHGNLTVAIYHPHYSEWQDFNFSGFDMISPIFHTHPLEGDLDKVEKQLKEVIGKAEKTKMPIFAIWVIRFANTHHAFEDFLANFENLAEAKEWYLRKTLELLNDSKVIGISAYSVYPSRRLEVIEGVEETYIWQDKRFFELVEKFFSNSYEENNIVKFLKVEVDGKNKEWQEIDPVFFNPSGILPDYSNIYYKKITGKKIENSVLKAVYAAKDESNLYLLLEFYRIKKIPSLEIDANDDGIYEILLSLEFPIKIERIIYTIDRITVYDEELAKFLPKVKIARASNFVEIGMPLELVGKKTRKIGLKISPEMAPGFCASMGGIELRFK